LAYSDRSQAGTKQTYSEVLSLYSKILSRADQSVRGWGGRLYFVYLPEWESFENPINVDGRRQAVLQMVKTLRIPVIDIYEAFKSHEDPLALFPFRINGHYNEKGHRLVADEVVRALSEFSGSMEPY
jgi:hypothetical protein